MVTETEQIRGLSTESIIPHSQLIVMLFDSLTEPSADAGPASCGWMWIYANDVFAVLT